MSANIVVAVVFAIAPHLPPVQEALGLEAAASAFSWMISIGSILYLLTSSVLLWHAGDLERRFASLDQDVRAALGTAPQITPIRDDEFYRDFLRAAEEATENVLISYFGNHAPDRAQHVERRRYYESLLQVMRENPRAHFRRLLRDTPANREWARRRTPQWIGLPNVSVAFLADVNPDHPMPIALSVQVIDSRRVWLVAVEGHERQGAHRDLSIKDATAAEMFAKYFFRLWGKAEVVVDGGIAVEGWREADG